MRTSILLLTAAAPLSIAYLVACGSADCRDTLTCPVTYVETGGGGATSSTSTSNGMGSGGSSTSAGGATSTSVGSGGSGGAATYPDALALGAHHSCYASGGVLKCWGRNDLGQLGLGMVSPEVTTATEVAISGVVDVAAGRDHTCAVTDDGMVYCWGSRQYGQVGTGDIGQPNPNPQTVLGITTAVEVAAGPHHACARLADGSAKCWGRNNTAQLGTGSSSTLEATTVDVPLVGIRQLASKGAQCAILDNNTLWCWGTGFTAGPPAQVTGIAGVQSVCHGAVHTCAVDATGSVSCWGDSECGQLGLGQDDSTTPMLVPGLSNFGSVTCSEFATMALRNDQTVRFWGATLGAQESCDDIETEPVVVSSLNGATLVDAGWQHKCVETGTGTVLCWGNNTYGQLGDGTMTSTGSSRVQVMGL